MIHNYTKNLRVLTLAVFAVLVSFMNAQTFPEFTNETPDGDFIQLFRSAPLIGDFNNNGNIDVLLLGRNNSGWAVDSYHLEYDGVSLNKTSNWHAQLGLAGNKIYNPTLAAIDYNNDGHLDLLLMGSKVDKENDNAIENLLFDLYKNVNGEFELVENSGLSPVFIEQENMYGHAIAVADFDNDGYQDIIITGKVNGNNKVAMYKNLAGTGEFELVVNPVQGSSNFENLNNGTISLGDFNNDGFVDILYNGWGNNGKLKLYKNIGNGEFEDMNIHNTVSNGTQKGRVLWADFNADGYLDFIVTGERAGDSWTKHADIYINNRDETFTEVEFQDGYALTGIAYGSVDAADFNGDGLLDLVIVGTDGSESSALYLNKGFDNDGKIGFDKQENTFGMLRSGASIQIADYDNDGYLDVFSMGYGREYPGASAGGRFFVWKNDGNLDLNTAPSAPTNLKSVYEDGYWTFSWDAATDTETPSDALAYNLYLQKSGSETILVLPADTATGFLKTNELTSAIRTTSYKIAAPKSKLKWGVQAIDQARRTSSFATDTTSTSQTGVDASISSNLEVYVIDKMIHIQTSETANVRVYDWSGNQLALISALSGKKALNFNHYAKGVYIVSVETQYGVENIKLIL